MSSERVGSYAALQSVAEVGLGSLIHAFNVPFGGQTLSLNQILILTLVAKGARHRRDAVSQVSGVGIAASLMKSLSPAGEKIVPMVAIACQAFLYAGGVAALGRNAWGVALGAGLSSLWAFLQPAVLAGLMFGAPFFEGLFKVFGPEVLAGMVVVKFALSLGIGIGVWRKPLDFEDRYRKKVQEWSRRVPRVGQASAGRDDPALRVGPLRGAASDLLNPWFVLSGVFSLGFLALTTQGDQSRLFVYGLRVVGVSFVLFWLVRVLPLERWLRRYPTSETPRAEGPEGTPPPSREAQASENSSTSTHRGSPSKR